MFHRVVSPFIDVLSKPVSGADSVISFCIGLNLGWAASPHSPNNMHSLVVRYAPASLILWKANILKNIQKMCIKSCLTCPSSTLMSRHQLLGEHQSCLTCMSLTLMSRHQLLGEHQSCLTCMSLTLMSRHQLLGEHQSCLTCLSLTLMSRHQLLGEHQSYLTCLSLTLMSKHQLLGEHQSCLQEDLILYSVYKHDSLFHIILQTLHLKCKTTWWKSSRWTQVLRPKTIKTLFGPVNFSVFILIYIKNKF